MLYTLFYPRRFPILSVVILGLLLVIPGIFASQIAPHDPLKGALSTRLKPPMWMQGGGSEFPLGTDKVGRDILSRIIHGARASLVVSTVALLMSGCLSIMLGVVAGYFGGRVDALILHLETPSVWRAMAVFLGLLFGSISPWAVPLHDFWWVTITIGILLWPLWSPAMRQVRSTVHSLRQAPLYRRGMRGEGTEIRLLFCVATLQGGLAIFLESGMSFLGMGIPRPTPTWGLMVADGWELIVTAWWLSTFPGLAILLTVVSLARVSNWLSSQLDSDSRWEDFPIFRGRYNRAKYIGTLLGASALFMIAFGIVGYIMFLIILTRVPLVPR